MIFCCDCVWVREGVCVEGEVHRRVCVCVCVCVCACICKQRKNVYGHVRNLSGMCISQ